MRAGRGWPVSTYRNRNTQSMKNKTLCCAAALALSSGTALAQTDSVELPETTVVGTSVIDQNNVDSFGSLTTVVGQEQIRDLNALDLSSALRRTPGVVVSRFNPVGSFGGAEGGAVYIRGMGASRPGSEIKTYIDGVPFYMGVWGHPLLDLLPINAMQSISVYKGPQPQKFGNTFAAIDLTPKVAEQGDNHHGELQLTGGSFRTATEQASLIGREGNFDYLLAQGAAHSDGDRSDGDGRLNNGMARLGYRLNDNWSTGLLVLHANNQVSDPGQKGLPETKNGEFNTRGTLTSLSVAHEHDWGNGSLKLYHNEGRGSALDQTGLDGDTISDFTLQGIRWEEQLRPWQGGEVALGLDVDESKGEVHFKRIAPAPQAKFDAPTLRVTSPHIAVSHAFALNDRWTLTPSAGVRTYEHNVFESATAPHAGLLLSSDNVEFRANASRGINYPGLEASVMSSLIPALGETWKDLKPEKLDHQEAGCALQPDRHRHPGPGGVQGQAAGPLPVRLPADRVEPVLHQPGRLQRQGRRSHLAAALDQQLEQLRRLHLARPVAQDPALCAAEVVVVGHHLRDRPLAPVGRRAIPEGHVRTGRRAHRRRQQLLQGRQLHRGQHARGLCRAGAGRGRRSVRRRGEPVRPRLRLPHQLPDARHFGAVGCEDGLLSPPPDAADSRRQPHKGKRR